MPTDQEHLAALKRAKAAGDTEAADYIRKQWMAETIERSRIENDPLKDTSGFQRAAINVGAGADSVIQGLKQAMGPEATAALGMDAPLDDAGVEEKRRLDEAAANSITGGGALQAGGGLAATYAGARLAGAVAAPLAAPLVRAAPYLQKATAAIANLGTKGKLALLGGVGGASDAALQPLTSEESRIGESAKGGAIGAVAGPVIGKGVEFLGDAARLAGGHFFPGVAERYGQKLAEKTAAKKLGSNLEAVTQDVANAPPRNLPLSAAAQSNNPDVIKMELESRRTNPTEWGVHDDAVNRGIASEADAVTRSGLDADALYRARKLDFQNALDKVAAGAAATPKKFTTGASALEANIDDALSKSKYGSGSEPLMDIVRGHLGGKNGVNAALARGDVKTAAEQIMQLRTDLSQKKGTFKGLSDPKSAVRQETINVILEQIDNVLNNSVGAKTVGKFKDALANFSKASPDVDAANLAKEIRKTMTNQKVKVVGPGVNPPMTYDVTPDVVKNARVAATEMSEKNPSAVGMRDRLIDLETDMALHERAATGRAGPAGPEVTTPWMPGTAGHAARQVISFLRGASDVQRKRIMAEALRDPHTFRELLDAAAERQISVGFAPGAAAFLGGEALTKKK